MGVKTRKLSQINDSLIEWQSVVVADGSTGLTAVAGRGYFINTTAGAITVTFPASPKIGDTIIINDYASTFNTNNVIINLNGNKLEADTTNATLNTNDQTHTFVFTDATQGWKIVNQDTGTSLQQLFISATGGTITTSGDFKIHSFTGDGCFVVVTAGNPAGSVAVDYLVVAGGGGGGKGADNAAGGGAGGFRLSNSTCMPAPTTSPLASPAGLPVSAQTYPITVGAGGVGGAAPIGTDVKGTSGSPSVFSTITSTGGGGGGMRNGSPPCNGAGLSGGSGGGGGNVASNPGAGGAGNTPPVNPSQGNNGGLGVSDNATFSSTGGGGGAGAVGTDGTPSTTGNGGVGSFLSPCFAVACAGTPGPAPGVRYFAGGAGGGNHPAIPAGGLGGAGGGGNGGKQTPTVAAAGTANTGGGGGGGASGTPNPHNNGAAGGKGIVVIRYKFQ